MSLKKYLSAISPASFGAVSETALYTPIATHILSGILGYAPKHYAINKSGAKGTPDIRIFSGEDGSEWIVCEAKLHDSDIRKESSRKRIWKEQIVERGYIRAETFYVLLCAPRTFYVCDLDGAILDGVHIEDHELHDINSGARLPQDDASFRSLLGRITYEASLERPQYEKFRRGELPGGYITLSTETIDNLQDVFDFSLRSLKAYGSQVFKRLKQEYQHVSEQLHALEQKIVDVGSDAKLQEPIKSHIRRLRRRHRLVLQLFDVDYPQFRHDQTYAGTKEESHFEDIFITNTAYIALSRLFFVRICEDIGLTSRKISHEGPGLWQRFVEHMKEKPDQFDTRVTNPEKNSVLAEIEIRSSVCNRIPLEPMVRTWHVLGWYVTQDKPAEKIRDFYMRPVYHYNLYGSDRAYQLRDAESHLMSGALDLYIVGGATPEILETEGEVQRGFGLLQEGAAYQVVRIRDSMGVNDFLRSVMELCESRENS